MIYLFKKIIASNVMLYKLWLKFWRSKVGDKVVLPKRGDKLFFDGYPRSGNTYFSGMIHYFFPGAIGSSHLHAKAPFKIALKNNIPSVIIFRDPKNCVASNQFRKTNGKFINESLLNNQLNQYIDYYGFILSKGQDVFFVNFEDVLSKPSTLLNRINERFKLQNDLEIDENRLEQYTNYMSEIEERKDVSIGSLPNKERNTYKKDIFELIEKNKNYPIALKIHQDLVRCAAEEL